MTAYGIYDIITTLCKATTLFYEEKRKMKRPMTLIAFILSTVFLGIDTILELISIPMWIQIINSGYGSAMGGVIALAIILLAFIILALVFNAICIAKWNKSVGAFAGTKGFIITTIVFNFIIVGLILISLIVNGAIAPMPIIMLLVLIATNVLVLIDLNMEKARVQAMATETAE